MPSSILNSDDGVISGTSGLKSSGGDDGVLVFQSKGTETARINTDKQIVAAAGTASLPALTTTGDVNTGIFFPAADTIAFAEGGAEAMRIDSDGDVGIGTNSPSSKLHVAAASDPTITLQNTAESTMTLIAGGNGQIRSTTALDAYTNGSLRARIDSSGFLLVGATTLPSPAGPASKMFLVSNAGNDGSWCGTFQGTGASTNRGVVVFYPNSSPNNVDNQAFYFFDSTTNRFEVRSNGGVANYSANNVNLSDRREKTNFAPAKNYLETICAIPVQTFNYIDQNMEEDGGLTLGVVAQDVQEVAPELVMESNWGTQEEPKMRLSIYQTDLQYALMKSIQELKAINDAQAQRIETLEAKNDALEARLSALEQA